MRTIIYILFIALFLGGETSAQSPAAQAGRLDSLLHSTGELLASDPDRALQIAKKIQVQALRRNDSLLFANALVTEGKARYYLGQINSGLSRINQAHSIFEKYHDEQGLLLSYFELAIIEAALGHTFEALVKFNQCLTLTKVESRKSWRPKVLYHIAAINLRQNESDLAWERSREAETLLVGMETDGLTSKIQSLKGLILLYRGELNLASGHLERARTLAEISGDSLAFMHAFAGLGRLEMARNNLDLSHTYISNALRISQKTGDPAAYPENLLLLSLLHLKKQENEAALAAAREANTQALALEEMAALHRDAALHLSRVYLAMGDSAKAFVYSSRGNLIDDSVLKDEVNKFVLLPEDYDTPEAAKTKKTNSNTGELRKKAEQLLSDEQVTLVIIGGLFLLCALLIIALILKKNRAAAIHPPVKETELPKEEATVEKTTEPESEEALQAAMESLREVEAKYQRELSNMESQLQDQQKLAEERQTELDTKNRYYAEMDKNKNKVFSVLTHDLRQPINQIKSVLNLLEMEELDGADRRQIVEKLKESVDNSSNALENLLLWSKKQLTGINTRIVDVHLLPQVWQLESHLKPNLEAKEIKLEINIPDFFKVKADMNQLDICLRNLLTNAIKFSNRGGTITIDAIEENGQKIVRVIDQGVGMTAEQVEKLKALKENFTTKGTMNEKGTGLGIMITSEFMENQQGKLEIISRKGEGSIFSLVFSAGSASRSQQPSPSNNS